MAQKKSNVLRRSIFFIIYDLSKALNSLYIFIDIRLLLNSTLEISVPCSNDSCKLIHVMILSMVLSEITIPLYNMISMQSFYLPHTECKIPNLTGLYSEYYKILPKDKSLFGGQTGDCIFAKKPIKSAKTHFF